MELSPLPPEQWKSALKLEENEVTRVSLSEFPKGLTSLAELRAELPGWWLDNNNALSAASAYGGDMPVVLRKLMAE